ncbi:MAG TPA: ATP-binding protein [Acidimicrobiales bacterium]|nr:ATP-binding protein [Acidimicrobiales bacterium]
MRSYLPRGNTLDDQAFRQRHLLLCWILALHLPALVAFGVWRGYGLRHTLLEVSIPAACLLFARVARERRLAAFCLTAGLVFCSSVLVHFSAGSIEAHFHFFVLVGLIGLYQDWVPFLWNVVFTVLSHGLGSAIAADLMFQHGAGQAHPWTWAFVHGVAVLSACLGVIVFWKNTEIEQERSLALAGELAAAELNAAQVEAAQRQSVSELFVNLARRNQSLLDRQLGLIAELEQRERRPDSLSELFQLDHLATRIRRNAESLLVLSGDDPPRRWGSPVPLGEVVRAAAAEVEDYGRVEVQVNDHLEVAGHVVADLAHLLAELIENATTFSPPTSEVRVRSHLQPARGSTYVISIEDTGIGMPDDDVRRANELLAEPPDVDLRRSTLGFHVVGRLAQRYGLRVTLAKTPGGGITALVTLADELVSERRPARADSPGTMAGRPVADPPGAMAGRPVVDPPGVAVMPVPDAAGAAVTAVPSAVPALRPEVAAVVPRVPAIAPEVAASGPGVPASVPATPGRGPEAPGIGPATPGIGPEAPAELGIGPAGVDATVASSGLTALPPPDPAGRERPTAIAASAVPAPAAPAAVGDGAAADEPVASTGSGEGARAPLHHMTVRERLAAPSPWGAAVPPLESGRHVAVPAPDRAGIPGPGARPDVGPDGPLAAPVDTRAGASAPTASPAAPVPPAAPAGPASPATPIPSTASAPPVASASWGEPAGQAASVASAGSGPGALGAGDGDAAGGDGPRGRGEQAPGGPTAGGQIPGGPTTGEQIPGGPTTGEHIPGEPTTGGQLTGRPTTGAQIGRRPTADEQISGGPTTDEQIGGGHTAEGRVPAGPTTGGQVSGGLTAEGLVRRVPGAGLGVLRRAGATAATAVTADAAHASTGAGAPATAGGSAVGGPGGGGPPTVVGADARDRERVRSMLSRFQAGQRQGRAASPGAARSAREEGS